jgi:hypothetical protein
MCIYLLGLGSLGTESSSFEFTELRKCLPTLLPKDGNSCNFRNIVFFTILDDWNTISSEPYKTKSSVLFGLGTVLHSGYLTTLSLSGDLRLAQRRFCGATQCSLIDIYQGFVRTCCLCPQGMRVSSAGEREVTDVRRSRTVGHRVSHWERCKINGIPYSWKGLLSYRRISRALNNDQVLIMTSIFHLFYTALVDLVLVPARVLPLLSLTGVPARLTFLPWRRRQLISSKRWEISTRLHDVLSQTTVIFLAV